jgi:1,4-alpha-glucan branching enzyme
MATRPTLIKKTAPPPPVAATVSNNGGKGRKRVVFKIAAPQASEVSVCGSFNDWEPGRNVLKKADGGVWKVQLQLEPGTYEYRYVVDGEWRDDPDATWRVPNEFGSENCVRNV